MDLALEGKNREIERFRLELDSILQAAAALQQGALQHSVVDPAAIHLQLAN